MTPDLDFKPHLVWPGLSGHFELAVETEGALSLPLEVISHLGLMPGDLLSLDPAPTCLHFEIYHEFLADNWPAVSLENRMRYLMEFLRRPLTALEQLGTLPIPREVFPLARGEKVVLQVMNRGLSHQMFLVRTQWD